MINTKPCHYVFIAQQSVTLCFLFRRMQPSVITLTAVIQKALAFLTSSSSLMTGPGGNRPRDATSSRVSPHVQIQQQQQQPHDNKSPRVDAGNRKRRLVCRQHLVIRRVNLLSSRRDLTKSFEASPPKKTCSFLMKRVLVRFVAAG